MLHPLINLGLRWRQRATSPRATTPVPICGTCRFTATTGDSRKFYRIRACKADSTANTFTGTLNGNDIALVAVPEPNVAALLGGFGVLALLRRRR